MAFTADMLHQGIAAIKDFSSAVLTTQQEADLLVACTELASNPDIRAFIKVGSEDDILRLNSLIKRLREGSSVAQIIDFIKFSPLSSSDLFSSARIDETHMEA